MTRSERWILSEWRVARDRVERLGETLVSHRERTPFAEVDLVFVNAGVLTVVEVKTWRGELWRTDLISARQTRRLKRARFHLEARHQLPTRLVLAVVDPDAPECDLKYFEGWTEG